MGGFHEGELAVQERAGLRAEADRLAGMARRTVPPAAAAFLAERPMLVVGAADRDGAIWCSPLSGPPGFLRVRDRGDHAELDVAATPAASDPLAPVLTGRAEVGAVAVDPGTRRRMRVNGVSEPTPGGLRITVEQAYANCPKYIQRRSPESYDPGPPGRSVDGSALDRRSRQIIAGADTFFVATASSGGAADASHRGGNPGFVQVGTGGGAAAVDELSWPDYPGNALMMTLGNLEQNPAAGLLFLDWSTGETLQLSGEARIEWAGTERSTRFRVRRVHRTERAVPLRWGAPELSRFNPAVPMVG